MSKRPHVAVLLVALALSIAPAASESAHPLHLAARNDDTATLERLLEGGADPNTRAAYDTTPLYLAAKEQHAASVALLLEHGADPDIGETFFNTSPLQVSLWGGAPDYAVTRLLLAGGATDRATVLDHALGADDLALARVAARSGTVTETEARDLVGRHADLDGPAARILAELKTRPDPPPPTYDDAELSGFSGTFTDSRSGTTATIGLAEDAALVLTLTTTSTDSSRTKAKAKSKSRSKSKTKTRSATTSNELTVMLEPTEERVFRGTTPDGAPVTVAWYGRAGTIEGIFVDRRGHEPIRLRAADTDAAELAETSAPSREIAAAATASDRRVVNWPGFRGANRDGIGDGADPPTSIDLESGKGVLWRASVPGLGNSSPIVWGDTVYVTTAVADGEQTPLRTGLTGAGDEITEDSVHRWLVLAYDKRTGEPRWEREVGRAVPLTNRHFKATQANSTAVTDGKRLVAVFPTAGLACLDARSGEILWKHELGGLNAGGFNDPGMQWGFAASPIIHDGRVVLQVDIHDGPYLAAWDLETGRELWRVARPGIAPSWATPAVWSTPRGEQLVVNGSVIHGYDPTDGSPLWSLAPTSVQVVASPVIGDDGLAYVSSGYPPARPIYAVRPKIAGDVVVEPGTEGHDALAWSRPRGGAYMPTPLLYRGLLYIVHHNGRIAAHEQTTGAIVAKKRLSAGGTCTASPVVANGVIYQGTEEGQLYVLEAGTELRELALVEFDAPLMATPAISEGVVFVRTPGELFALGAPAGG